jgi:hypothetical protein
VGASTHLFSQSVLERRVCVCVCECFKISVFTMPTHEMESVCVCVCVCVCVHRLGIISMKSSMVTHVKDTKAVFCFSKAVSSNSILRMDVRVT